MVDDLLDMFDDSVRVDRTNVLRAPFGMPGAKNRSLKHLLQHLPYRDKWIDLFGGTGVVSWNRAHSKQLNVYNDRYSGVTNFYRCLQDAAKKKALCEFLEFTCASRELFYKAKMEWAAEQDDVTRAAKWYYMMRQSVIGKGAAFARTTNSRYMNPLPGSLELFHEIHNHIKTYYLIENLDFEQCHSDFDSQNSVFYADSPYIGTDPGIYEHKWTRNDTERLLATAGRSKGFFALSGYADAQINNCSFWTDRHTWEVNVTSEVRAFLPENFREGKENVQKVDKVMEVLWIKET